MGFVRQTWTLTKKNLLIVFVRHWFSTTIRAFLAPIIFMFIISYVKNFFVPPSDYGIGSAIPVRDLSNALNAAGGGRDTVAFVHNGFTGGAIEQVINQVAGTVRDAGKNAAIVAQPTDVNTLCPTSLRGTSTCFGAIVFHSSPDEGPYPVWNYTLRVDGDLGVNIYVDRDNNDAQLYVLPLQRAVDAAISSNNGTTLPAGVENKIFTSQSPQERQDDIRRSYMEAIINIIGVAFFIGVVGVTYQLTGQMATERELGMSQLIEAMTPNSRRWYTQAARLISNHLAFDIIYAPGWIIMSLIMARLVFPNSSVAVILIYHIIVGLALSSFSILGASLFRKAQLSGITVTIVSILLAIVAQVVGPDSAGAVAILSLLFPPMNYVFFIHLVARWERQDLGTNLVKGAPENPWQLPGIAFWIFAIVQIFVFPVLGALIERSLYGTASKARKVVFNPADPSRAVVLSDFSKHYEFGWWTRNVSNRFGAKKETVKAVNGLNLVALKGQIMVLLGANGSGKSTTLDAISGLNSITGGTIEVDGTGGLGYCPQKNVLWDDLTVYEHVKIFNALKSTGKKDTKAEIDTLINGCDLDLKAKAKSKTLSGGQKRKLQLAMMFTGGSQVCCVDEISSGLDPLSRRKIWDILLAERGRRSMILTTHFLDEADVLSDYIAIMSKGHLKADGTAVELKHKFGGGYRIHVYNNVAFTPTGEFADVPKTVVYDQTIYHFPGSAEAARFVAHLDERAVSDYIVSGPTIEDVFLKLAEEVKEDLHQNVAGDNADITPAVTQQTLPEKGFKLSQQQSNPSTGEPQGIMLSTGRGTSIWKQTWILFVKRIIILRRNTLPYAAAVLIPVIAAGLVTFFLNGFERITCSPAGRFNTPRTWTFASTYFLSDDPPRLPIGPPNRVSAADLAGITGLDETAFTEVSTINDFNNFISANYANVTPGGLFLGDQPTFAWRANWDIYYGLFSQNLLNNVLGETPIFTSYQPFARPFAPGTGDTLQLILYFGLAMSAYPAFFALYPTVERLRKVRALHYSNGIRAGPLWLAYLCFDFMFVLLVSAVTVIIFVAVSDVWYYPGYLFVVFFLYGLTSILTSYVISLFVTSQLAAFAFAAGYQCVMFLLYFIGFMSIQTYSPAYHIDRDVTIFHFAFSTISPSGNLIRTLFLTLNDFNVACDGFAFASYPGALKVYGGPILYLIIQAFVLLGILIWWDSGYGLSIFSFGKKSKVPADDFEERTTSIENPAIADELTRVSSRTGGEAGLRVMHLTKSFGRYTAVEDLSFRVTRGEVFALLGPNGAGKSTTISLIRGDIRPSRRGGDIHVEGISITKQRAKARQHLGVCPQFDAMDSMTVLEHLRFYAKARGVEDVEHNVREVVRAVGLEPFKSRMAAKLSGGNKRKLSLGIALMGNPSVILLDEPSSGMDAASKRVMWRTLASVTTGRALVITTHSMEEADALADRAGIMARRMLAMGTADSLRRDFGDEYHVQIIHKDAPHTAEEEMQRVRAWIVEHVRGARVEERMFHGQVRFSVPNGSGSAVPRNTMARNRDTGVEEVEGDTTSDDVSPVAEGKTPATGKGTSIAALFSLLEANKENLNVAYYSVSATTLDQVFLTIVGRHDVQEENSHGGEKGGEKGGKGKRRGVGRGFGRLFGR